MSVHKINPHGKWLNTVEAFYDQHDKKGGYQILFPCYRPDLCKSLAHHLGLNLYDFRQEKMQPLGWDANQITLHELTNTLLEKAANTGIVAHNIEALLATKSVQERVQWLTNFLAIDSILPLAIYQGEAVEEHPRVCDIELEYFPEQSFISRLAM
jgi:hypothetical protein